MSHDSKYTGNESVTNLRDELIAEGYIIDLATLEAVVSEAYGEVYLSLLRFYDRKIPYTDKRVKFNFYCAIYREIASVLLRRGLISVECARLVFPEAIYQ